MNASVTVELDRWREGLQSLGFSDDGDRLRGNVRWQRPDRVFFAAQVEIIPDERFPFAPPKVWVIEAGDPSLKFSFHIERSPDPMHRGHLCLWEDDWDVGDAPWRDPELMLERIAGWLTNTSLGWPNDDACDLERYLPPEAGPLVLYNSEDLRHLNQVPVRVLSQSGAVTVSITKDVRRTLEQGVPARVYRKDHHLAWVEDLGIMDRPISSWNDLEERLGPKAAFVTAGVKAGLIERFVLRYQRGTQNSVLVVRSRTASNGEIRITSCESADISSATRNMRAGRPASAIADTTVAVVGCGAVGSFATDLIFRSGIKNLTLIDGEILRPGNIVRHLAGRDHVGLFKVAAVLEHLKSVDDADDVHTRIKRVQTLPEAVALVDEYDIVLDATASASTSSLLTTAAQMVVGTVVSVCVQREGDVVRVDRFPARQGETYLPALSPTGLENLPWESGCGSPVSLTPPGAVVAAAELATRVVIDEALRSFSLPASLAEVRRPQPERPFNQMGLAQGAVRQHQIITPQEGTRRGPSKPNFPPARKPA